MDAPKHVSGELCEGTRLLERYTIIDEFGSGGMSSLYRARDDRLKRVVCVKLMRGLFDAQPRESEQTKYQSAYAHFLQEAMALSKLQHPNTLRIYDFGYLKDTGRPFQVSEFLDGGDLRRHVRSHGRLSFEQAIAVLEPIAGAVAEAHSQGIIHRDIKPANILFARVGRELMPKLADFGIAYSESQKDRLSSPPALDESTTESSLGEVQLFSPRWAAPEQLGAAEPEGPHTDVYALGLVVAYMIAGKTPYRGTDMESSLRERMAGDAFLEQRLKHLGIADGPREAILRATRSDPAQRISSPLALVDELWHTLESSRADSHRPLTLLCQEASAASLSVERPAEVSPEPEDESPLEGRLPVGDKEARVIEVHDKVELTFTGATGGEMRCRVTIIPTTGHEFVLNIKGLNCFVARPDGHPSPAMVANADGSADLVSVSGEVLGSLQWSFGSAAERGRVFHIQGSELMVSYEDAAQSVALFVGQDREVVIVCRRV